MGVHGWRAALVVIMAAGLAFALRPLAPMEGPENWFPHADKVHHLWYFGLLWCLGSLAGIRSRVGWALTLLGYGILIEVSQHLVGTRLAQWGDVAADTAGICLGYLGTLAWQRRRSGGQPEEDRR